MNTEPAGPAKKDLSLLVIHSKADEGAEEYAPSRAWMGWTAAALVLAGAGAALYLNRDSLFPPEVKTMTVRVPTRAEANALLTASGYLVAQRESNVAPKVVGTVTWIGVREGSRVAAGEPLVRLDDREFQSQRAELVVQIEQDRRELRRLENLVKDGFVSEADVERARNRLDLSEARLRTLDTQIENTVVRAPFAGVVTSKGIEVGEIVTSVGSGYAASGGVVKVVDMDSIELEADVTESSLHRVKEGQPAEVRIDSLPGEKLRGRLRQVIPTADRQKATVKVKVSLLAQTPEEKALRARLLPEMAAQATFMKEESVENESLPPPPMTIPAAAIRESEGNRSIVFVVREGAAWRREIEVASVESESAQVRSGLAEGDVLVVEGVMRLKDGQKIKIKNGA